MFHSKPRIDPLLMREQAGVTAVPAQPWDPSQACDASEVLEAIAESLSGLDRREQHLIADTSFSLDREGELWHVRFAGRSAHIRHAKGLADLAVLWAHPGREIAAVDLFAGPDGPSPAPVLRDQVLDHHARAEYRARLAAIDEGLEEAQSWNDLGRVERLRNERQTLIAELETVAGLGGRVRNFADPGERARKAVTARIRDAIRKIRAAHPELGAHLETSVATGTRCSYTPAGTKVSR